MRIASLLLVVFLAVLRTAVAQTASDETTGVDETLIEFCRVIVAHVPDDDVRYRPGVDAQGRPVSPADVEGGRQVVPPNIVEIPLTIPLRELIGDASPSMIGAAEANVGRVTVNRESGVILYDGQLLAGGMADELKRSCLRVHLK